MPKVSVIIPVYRVEQYIERCARSLFEQTLDDIEYLFIDDCTPDKSVDVLKSVLEDYPHRKDQVIIHCMEQNSGQAVVRKWGMLNATGEYVIHCDSDDWVDNDMYRIMYEEALKEDSDIVCCEHYDVNIEERCCSAHRIPSSKVESLFCFPTLWEKLVRRTLITDNEILFPEGNMGEDQVLSVQLFWYAKKCSYLKAPLYYYSINPESISNTISEEMAMKRFNMYSKNIELINRFLTEHDIEGIKYQLDALRKSNLNWLLPLIKNNEILNLYRTYYPGLFFRVAFNRYVTFKEKVVYYIAFFGIYTFSQKLTNKGNI